MWGDIEINHTVFSIVARLSSFQDFDLILILLEESPVRFIHLNFQFCRSAEKVSAGFQVKPKNLAKITLEKKCMFIL